MSDHYVVAAKLIIKVDINTMVGQYKEGTWEDQGADQRSKIK